MWLIWDFKFNEPGLKLLYYETYGSLIQMWTRLCDLQRWGYIVSYMWEKWLKEYSCNCNWEDIEYFVIPKKVKSDRMRTSIEVSQVKSENKVLNERIAPPIQPTTLLWRIRKTFNF